MHDRTTSVDFLVRSNYFAHDGQRALSVSVFVFGRVWNSIISVHLLYVLLP